MSWNKFRVRVVALRGLYFALLVAFFAGLYGFIPGLQVHSLGLWYTTWGTSLSIASQRFPDWFTCHDILIPYGSPQLGGFLVHWLTALFIKIFSAEEDVAGNLTGIVFLVVALYAFVRLMAALNVRRSIGYLCGSLFLMTPFIFRHLDYGSMGFGFMLLPLGVLADIVVVQEYEREQERTKKTYIALITKVVLIRLLMAGVDWYATVIAMVGGGVVISYCLILYVINHKKISTAVMPALLWGITWIAGVLPWYLAMPGEKLTEPFSLDLFRGQGVDLITTVVPRGDYLWGSLVNLPLGWPGIEFYGDSTNVDYNYLGYTFLIAITVALVILVKSKGKRDAMIPLVIAGAACFVLSLGPSLKVDSRRSSEKAALGQLTYGDYHMPAEKAVVSLPTSFIYNLFPISMMRATYRWLLFFKVVLIISFGWLVNWLIDKDKKRIAWVLGLLALVEFFPDFPHEFTRGRDYYDQYQWSNHRMVDSLRSEVNPGERVVFLSSSLENDYLATWFAPKLGVRLFNGGGDKSNWLATRHMPEVIERLKRYDVRTNDEIKELILLALRSGVVDKIVVPYFSLHWDSYAMGPDKNRSRQLREGFQFLDSLRQDGVAIATHRIFSVLSTDRKYSNLQTNVAEQLDSVVQFMTTLPDSTVFLVDGAKAPLTELFSSREQRMYDYRQSEFVDAGIRRNLPMIFVLTGYQKYFDRENYRLLYHMLEKNKLFQTEDYSLFKISSFTYFRLNPSVVDNVVDCVRIRNDINAMAKDSDIETWSEIIDFSKGDYQDQLCRGWYELEHTEGRGYRWMGRSSTVFLPALGRKPKDLVVTGYPLVSRLPGKVENLSVYLNGYRLGHYALSKQDPFEIRAPVTEAVRLDAKVVTVTIEVDKTIPPSHQDQRELGIIISKIGFE